MISPALTVAATKSTKMSVFHIPTAASPTSPLRRQRASFRLKRAVVDAPSADAQTSLSHYRRLVFRLSFPADGSNRAGGRLRGRGRDPRARSRGTNRGGRLPRRATGERAPQPWFARGLAGLLPHRADR